jgi:hypothetical protein
MPNKSSHADESVAFSVVVADAFDGAVRLLSDAQRFGFRVRAFSLNAFEAEGGSIHIALAVPSQTDAAQIGWRLARHPTVVSLEII